MFTNSQEEPFGSEADGPTVLEKRAEVMRWEDTALKKYIDKNQLTRWGQAALEHADRTVRFNGEAAANGFANGHGANGHVLNSVEDGEEEDGDEQMDDDADEIS